jgi:hypothetical protein
MTEIEEEISIVKVTNNEKAIGSIEEPEQTDIQLVSKFDQQKKPLAKDELYEEPNQK